MKRVLSIVLIIGALIALSSCNKKDGLDDYKPFDQYRQNVAGEYTGTLHYTIKNHGSPMIKDYKFNIIEPSAGSYEIVFDSIITPDSTYQLENTTFTLAKYNRTSYFGNARAVMLINPGQYFEASVDSDEYENTISAPMYNGRSNFMVILLQLTATNSEKDCMDRISINYATKPF